MGDFTSDVAAPELVLERLTLKGKGILDLCLDLGKDLCVKGFIDAQIARGEEFLPVVEAMRDHIDAELHAGPHGQRRRLLLDLKQYIAAELDAARAMLEEPAASA